MTTAQLNRKISNLPRVIPGWVDSFIKSVDDQILDRNVEQMEKHGELYTEKSIYGAYEDDKYAASKRLLGRESRFVNLHNEGDFHSKMKLDVKNGAIQIESTDEKNDILVKLYTEDIFGLNDANMDWLVDELADDLTDRLRTYFT